MQEIEILIDRRYFLKVVNNQQDKGSNYKLTRGATITGCAPAVSFVVRGFISTISKVKSNKTYRKNEIPRL